jgi:hypothetical protein
MEILLAIVVFGLMAAFAIYGFMKQPAGEPRPLRQHDRASSR